MIAYGQTSSVLTDQHKINAEKEREIKSSLKFDSKTQNFDRVFPETTEIFDHIYDMDKSIEFRIKVSYFEIYVEMNLILSAFILRRHGHTFFTTFLNSTLTLIRF